MTIKTTSQMIRELVRADIESFIKKNKGLFEDLK